MQHEVRTGDQGIRSVDVSSLFAAFGITKSVIARFNEHTYEFDPDIKNNWLYAAFKGFQVLGDRLASEGKSADTFVAVGTGSGLDAIGASHIFQPNAVVLTDIHPRVVPLAEQNAKGNILKGSVVGLTGDLCEPLRQHNIKADVIYANLPLIPDDDETILGGMRSSSFVSRSRFEKAPKKYKRYLLGMIHAFLEDAKESLNPDGSVVINLGGRVPVELVKELFAECGYEYEELYTMLKAQSQPEEVLPGFSQVEAKEGVEFDFYKFDEAEAALQNVDTATLSAQELKDLLAPYRVTAMEALALHRSGTRIGQIVQVIRGKLPSNSQ